MSSSEEPSRVRTETLSELISRQTNRFLQLYRPSSESSLQSTASSEQGQLTPDLNTRGRHSFIRVDSEVSFRARALIPQQQLTRSRSLPSSLQTIRDLYLRQDSSPGTTSPSRSSSQHSSSYKESSQSSLSLQGSRSLDSEDSLFGLNSSASGSYETPVLSPSLSVETFSADSAEEIEEMADARLNAIQNDLQQVRANMTSNGLKPDPFNGDLEANHSLFLDHFNAYSQSLNWDDAAKARHFPLFLRSSAFVDFMAQPQATRDNWGQIETYFNDTYGSPDRKYIWRNMLTSRSLQPGEKLTKYAQDIKDLCQRLQLDQQHMVSFFIKGLPKKYSTMLAPLQPENINSALQKLSLFLVESGPDDYDNSLFPIPSQKEQKPSGQTEGVQQALMKILDIREKETEELKKKLEKLENRLDSNKSRQVKAIKMGTPGNQGYFQPPPMPALLPPGCQLCGGGDHLAPACPCLYNKVNTPQRTFNQSRNVQRTQNILRCYICNSPDHFKRDCPQNPYINHQYQPSVGTQGCGVTEGGYHHPPVNGDMNQVSIPKNGVSPHNG